MRKKADMAGASLLQSAIRAPFNLLDWLSHRMLSFQFSKCAKIREMGLVFCRKLNQSLSNSTILKQISLLIAESLREIMSMKVRFWLLGGATILLAACDDFQAANSSPSDGFIKELPEGVLSIVAPYQDLNSVRIDPADGCFVYRHMGPVETTFLPLRSANGRPICTRQPEVS